MPVSRSIRQGLIGSRMIMKRNAVKAIVAVVLMIVAFYGGWLVRGVCFSHGATDDVVPDESSTFNTIDSILLQAILYSKVKGAYPDFSLIEIPIDTLVKKGRPADQYGRAIRYSVTNDVLNVRSAGRDGLFETDDDIIGVASLNQTGRHIKGKCGTFDYEVEW